MGMDPQRVNSRGDTLSLDDALKLTGNDNLRLFDAKGVAMNLTPQQRAEYLHNWLTAGGGPKPLDPSKIFGAAAQKAPARARAAAGQGIGSLFGLGSLIGGAPKMDLQTGVPNASPAMPKFDLFSKPGGT